MSERQKNHPVVVTLLARVSLMKSKIFIAGVVAFLLINNLSLKRETDPIAIVEDLETAMAMTQPQLGYLPVRTSRISRFLSAPSGILKRRLKFFPSADFDTGPKIAWLACFPQSGALFIQRSIHMATETSTAIAYGNAVMEEDYVVYINKHASVNVYEGHDEGPYTFSDFRPLPTSGSILTMTYCNGFCSRSGSFCQPNDFHLSRAKEFFNGCMTGSHYPVAGGTTIQTETDFSKVDKALHLIRSPFTNVVTRFEHKYKYAEMTRKTGWMRLFPGGTAEGFQAFCRNDARSHNDGRLTHNKRQFLTDPSMQAIQAQVPCYEDFYRYAQWHNYMFQIEETEVFKGIVEVKVMYYEDFEANPATTMDELIEWLGLTKVSAKLPPVENIATAGLEYYNPAQKVAIKEWVQFYSTPKSWSHISKYFN